MRRKSAGGRPRPLRVLRGGKANCSRFHCSSVRSVGYKVVFCILPYSKPRLDIRCPRTQKDQKMIFQTRSEAASVGGKKREIPGLVTHSIDRSVKPADRHPCNLTSSRPGSPSSQDFSTPLVVSRHFS